MMTGDVPWVTSCVQVTVLKAEHMFAHLTPRTAPKKRFCHFPHSSLGKQKVTEVKSLPRHTAGEQCRADPRPVGPTPDPVPFLGKDSLRPRGGLSLPPPVDLQLGP